jgi:cytochrome c oxidase subunit IV
VADHVAHDHDESAPEGAHATNQMYVRIAIILAVITLVEVVIYYIPTIRSVLVPALLVLSIAKFLMVVGYFMHLKFDNRLYRFMFASGLMIPLGVYLALLAMQWTRGYWFPLPTA